MLEDLNQKICTTRTLKEDGSLQEIETCRIPFDIEKAKNGAEAGQRGPCTESRQQARRPGALLGSGPPSLHPRTFSSPHPRTFSSTEPRMARPPQAQASPAREHRWIMCLHRCHPEAQPDGSHSNQPRYQGGSLLHDPTAARY